MKSQAYRMTMLFDFYGDVLTDRQKEFYDLYYNEDLSLSEIAAHSGITRQGVRDSIKRAESVLLDLEERLGLARKFRQIQDGLDQIIRNAKQIGDYSSRYGISKEISERSAEIVRIANSINE